MGLIEDPERKRDFPRLREKLRAERTHIVPDDFDPLFESDYDPRWTETFVENGNLTT